MQFLEIELPVFIGAAATLGVTVEQVRGPRWRAHRAGANSWPMRPYERDGQAWIPQDQALYFCDRFGIDPNDLAATAAQYRRENS